MERAKKPSISKGPAKGTGKMEHRIRRREKAEPCETVDQWYPLCEREHSIGIWATAVDGEKAVLRGKFVDIHEKC